MRRQGENYFEFWRGALRSLPARKLGCLVVAGWFAACGNGGGEAARDCQPRALNGLTAEEVFDTIKEPAINGEGRHVVVWSPDEAADHPDSRFEYGQLVLLANCRSSERT